MCNNSYYCGRANDSGNNSHGFRLNPLTPGYFNASLILMWINTVLIISLNSAVIVTILRYRKSSRLYFLLLNLAVADLVTGVSDALPNVIERSVGMPYYEALWVFGVAVCKVQRTLASTSMTTSNYILAVTSMDRAMVIYSPMKSFRKGKLLQKCTILMCWSISFICCAPLLKFVELTPAQIAPSEYYRCELVWGHFDAHFMWKVMVIVMFIIVFAVPFTIIAISYVILLISIHRLSRNSSCGSNNQRPSLHVFNSGLPRSKIKSIRLTFGIILSFIICWLVFFVILFQNVFHDFRHPFVMVGMTCYYWNSVANPILFFIYHRTRTPSTPNSYYKSNGYTFRCNNSNSDLGQKTEKSQVFVRLCHSGNTLNSAGMVGECSL